MARSRAFRLWSWGSQFARFVSVVSRLAMVVLSVSCEFGPVRSSTVLMNLYMWASSVVVIGLCSLC